MANKPMDPNAIKALNQMQMEITKEFENQSLTNNENPINNIFTAGPVGGLMTRRLVEMGEKELINKKK